MRTALVKEGGRLCEMREEDVKVCKDKYDIGGFERVEAHRIIS